MPVYPYGTANNFFYELSGLVLEIGVPKCPTAAVLFWRPSVAYAN